jgi:hypothetical protein
MVAALALWPLAGCQSLAADLAPSGPALPGGAIPLQVVKDGTGSVLVFVAVSIQGQGPYTFVLDTGASRTVIDRQVADSLQLETLPAIPIASDVSGAVQARIVRVRDWRAGDVQLPAAIVGSLDLSGPNSPAMQQLVSQRFDGLLGSDVLSSFGADTIDYANGALTLSPPSG